jgi:hypothetical protein
VIGQAAERPTYLGSAHPLAVVAAGRCRESHGRRGGSFVGGVVGGVACGACWERAIRDDERVVVLFGLPREIEPDLSYVDEVAVDRVCAGERLALTAAERSVAARRMRAAGLSVHEVACRLGASGSRLAAALSDRPGRGDDEVAA